MSENPPSKEISREIPIAMLGEIGVTFDPLQKAVSSACPGICTRVPSMVDAFQLIINKGRGIIFIRMEDKQVLADFAKTFQIAIRQLNVTQIKILIFSTKNEILGSRALIQFPFIRTMTPIFDAKRLTTILVNECTTIQTKTQRRRSESNGLSSGIIVIKGDQKNQASPSPMIQDRDNNRGHKIVSGDVANPQEKTDWLPVPNLNGEPTNTNAKPKPVVMKNLKAPPWNETKTMEDKQQVMQSCIGANIPTFIYNEELSWRVRGYFSDFNSTENTVTFVVSHSSGAEKLNEEVRKSNFQFLSSTSTAKARVCSSIAFMKNNNLEFIFRTPDTVQGIQRRINQRAKMTPEMPVLIQYYDERLTADRTLNILDMSIGGLGIRLDKDFVADFEPGRKMSNLHLFLFNRVIRIPEAEVRHCSLSDVNPDFKILGLQTSGLTSTDLNFIEMFVLSQAAGQPAKVNPA